jgi:hypothetical protein
VGAGRSIRHLLYGENLVPLPLALAAGHVDGRPPEDEEDILHGGEATGVAVTPVLLGLVVLRGGAAVKPRIFIENPNPCTIAIVPGSVATTYRTSHR